MPRFHYWKILPIFLCLSIVGSGIASVLHFHIEDHENSVSSEESHSECAFCELGFNPSVALACHTPELASSFTLQVPKLHVAPFFASIVSPFSPRAPPFPL